MSQRGFRPGPQTVQSAVADDVLCALSNSTRRPVLERLTVGPATFSELAAPFDMKLPSFPGCRPAVFDDVPITAIVTMDTVGTGARYLFTALHRDEADFEKNKESGWQQGTEIGFSSWRMWRR